MRPIRYTLPNYAAGVAAGIAASQAGTGNTPLTLVGVGGGPFNPLLTDVPRTVLFTALGDESGNRFVIRGAGTKGNEIYEAFVGPNTTTYQTVNVFTAIYSITPELDTAANVLAGTISDVPSPWIPLDYVADDAPVAVSLFAPAGAAGISAAVELTQDQLGYSTDKHSNHHGSVFSIFPPPIFSLTPSTPITLAAAGELAEQLGPVPATAIRFVNTGQITAGFLQMRIVQGHSARRSA